jgi:hypothetical protein
MQDRRLFFRVVLKTLVFSGVLILLLVFFNSLFTTQQTEKSIAGDIEIIQLDIGELQPGKIKKVRWKDKEVAVLYRLNQALDPRLNVFFTEDLDKSLDTGSRSQKPEYFVYLNKGDSGNCPLFYSQGVFKDICTGNKFDENGRAISTDQGSFVIKIPPHDFQGDVLVLGSWPD